MLQADREVDARGLNCPLPILRTKKALNDMRSGQVIRITATDPASVRDFQAFARQTGNELSSTASRRRVLVHDAPALIFRGRRLLAAAAVNAALLLLPDFLLIALGASPCRVRVSSTRGSGPASSASSISCCFRRCCSVRWRSRRCGFADAGALAVAGLGFTLGGMLALGARASAVPAAAPDIRRVLPVRLPLQHLRRVRGGGAHRRCRRRRAR